MATIDSVITLPEDQNIFYTGMASLLNRFVYNVTADFIRPQITDVVISGRVVPGSTVVIFVNNVNQTPTPDIIADDNGAWSSTILLGPGQNTIQVQFFVPELMSAFATTFSPTILVNNVLIHPTLFSAFDLESPVEMVLLDPANTNLYVGGVSGGPSTQTLAKFDVTTGIGTFLEFASGSPLSGFTSFMALDSNWLYVAQTMDDSTTNITRYAKDLSAASHLNFSTVPTSLLADGTNVYSARSTGSDLLLAKVNPSTMVLVGSEVSLKSGAIGENFISQTQMTDDGTNLMVPVSRQISGDGPGNQIEDGTPGMGANLVLYNVMTHGKVLKSAMTNTPFTLYTTNSSDAAYVSKNSLVVTGGFYYTLAQTNPGRIVKLQEQTLSGLHFLVPVDLVPLPFDATDAGADGLTAPKLKLGADGRIYVTANSWTARWTPGMTSMLQLHRGTENLDITSSYLALIDDTNPLRSVVAPTTVFTDRATTFTVVAPPLAPANLRCHWNGTQTAAGVAWDAPADGSGVIVEISYNGGPFFQVKSEYSNTETVAEYFGNAMYVQATAIQNSVGSAGFFAGDSMTFRAKSFNTVGQSGYSATTTVSVPFLQPPISDQTGLSETSKTATTVALQWTDTEIDLSQHGNVGPDYNRTHFVHVYRSTDNFVSDNELVGTVNNSQTQFPYLAVSTTLVFTDTTAAPGTLYYYRVQGASNFYAPSNFSNVISVTTNAIVNQTVPSAQMVATMASAAITPVHALSLNLVNEVDLTTASAEPSFSVSSGNVVWAYRGSNAFTSTNLFRVDFSGLTAISAAIPAQSIAYDGANLWAVQAAGTLQKLNPTTLAVVATVGSALESVYWDGTNLWVMNSTSVVSQVNRATPSLTAIGSAGGGYVNFSGETMFGMATIGSFVYALVAQGSVTASKAPVIRKINTSTLAFTDTAIPNIALCNNMYGDGTYLYLKSRTSQQIWQVDPMAMAIINAIPTRPISGSAPMALLNDNSGFFQDWQRTLPLSTTYRDLSGAITTAMVSTDVVIGDTGNGFKVMAETTGSVLKFKRYPTASYNLNEASFSNLTYSAIAVPAAATTLNHSTSGTTVILTWTDNASGLGVFLVDRSQDGGVTYTTISTQQATGYSDTTPPGGGVTLIYRVRCFNVGGFSSAVTTTLTSPNTSLVIQINDASATGQHIAYTTLGTDTWAAWSTGSQIRAMRITSGLSSSVSTINPSNTGGAVVRMLNDGTNFYTVTAGSPVIVSKYDASGNFISSYSVVGTTTDATIGAGFIWFTFGVNLQKLLTSNMTTVTTPLSGNTINMKTVDYDAAASLVFALGGLNAFASVQPAITFNPSTDAIITNSSLAAQEQIPLDAVVGFDTAFSTSALYVLAPGGGTLSTMTIDTYNTGYTTINQGVNESLPQGVFKSLQFDLSTNDVYAIFAGSPGAIRKMDSRLNLINTFTASIATGQDDNFIRNNGNTFVTITDGTATSGLSVLTLVL